MTDLISRDDAINAHCALCPDKKVCNCDICPDVELFRLIHAEPKWIPCSERLPHITDHHVSKPCLVYCDNGAYTFAELEENIFGQVGWDCERDDDYHEAVGVVVAWMPLPDPWKGEEE